MADHRNLGRQNSFCVISGTYFIKKVNASDHLLNGQVIRNMMCHICQTEGLQAVWRLNLLLKSPNNFD
jgi:hypothetical protein